MLELDDVEITCPYCAEPISVLVDASVGDQAYIEDCSVCCQPMQVTVQVGDDGVHVQARAEDEV